MKASRGMVMSFTLRHTPYSAKVSSIGASIVLRSFRDLLFSYSSVGTIV